MERQEDKGKSVIALPLLPLAFILLPSVEAPTGFEPVIRVLQTHALPLGYGAGGATLNVIRPRTIAGAIHRVSVWCRG